MTILVTGAAGFIGFHLCHKLLEQGNKIVAIDNLNDYYDVKLKRDRLQILKNKGKNGHFHFYKIDISDRKMAESIISSYKSEIRGIIHLAAQAGVRYSLDHPFKYSESNLTGHLVILEISRHLPHLSHMVYASSSSVYGANTKQPFSVNDITDSPVSLYAATKKAGELMSYAYNNLYKITMTGLRFFTVYGEWGRPDMAYFSFTKAISEGKPIKVFNNGDMKRDFTYIDDIIDGVIACYETRKGMAEHKVYNLGNNQPEKLTDMINILENSLGKKAIIEMMEMQPGDVKETYADIEESTRDFGYIPKINISEGLPLFVEWYKRYYG